MTVEENQALAAEEEVTNQAAEEAALSSQDTDQGGEDTQQADGRDYEAEARASGWVPESEWRGADDKRPPKFLSAEEFVKRGEEFAPFIRKENKQLKEELESTKTDFAKRLERMEKMGKEAVERQKASHKAEMDRLKKEMRQAAEDGDVSRFDELELERDRLAEQKFDEPSVATGDDPDAVRNAWVSENGWYLENFEMAKEADQYANFLAKKRPADTAERVDADLKAVRKHIEAKFPEHFGGTKKSAANGHAAVDSGGDFPGAGRKAGPSAKLPSEARAQAEKDVQAGLYKNVDEWAKVYFS